MAPGRTREQIEAELAALEAELRQASASEALPEKADVGATLPSHPSSPRSRPSFPSDDAESAQVTAEHPGRYNLMGSSLKEAELGHGGIGRVLRMRDDHLGHSDFINNIAFSPDSRLLASAADDHTVRVWDLRTRRAVLALREQNMVVGCALSPDLKLLAVSPEWETRIYPLDLSLREADPAGLLDAAQREAQVKLVGFELKASGGP